MRTWIFQLLQGSVCLNAFCHRTSQRCLRWLNTVLAVCEYMSFARSWQEKGCSSQAETWQVKNILMKDFYWHIKFDDFLVSMATWTIEYNLEISLLLSLKKIHTLDFPLTDNLHIAYYNNHYHLKLIRQILAEGFLDNL